MRLWLIQHGEALSEEDDPARPLTEQGRRAAQRTAGRVAALGASPKEILHSGKDRARETAEIVAQALGERDGGEPPPLLEEVLLVPTGDPAWLEQHAAEATGDILAVGHMPHLGRVASRLLAGRDVPLVVRFHPGGVIGLERMGGGRFELVWAIPPDVG